MTTAAGAVSATAIPVLEFGRAWIIDSTTVDRADQLGLDGLFGFWVNGRAGVLGDVDFGVAAAAVGFGSPAFIERQWTHRPDDLSSIDCARAYAETAAEWGRSQLAGIATERLERLDRLVVRVVDTADSSTGVLFAGWRALSHPDDPAGRVTVRLNVLREMRGGAHLSAVQAVGLGPLGAVISTDDPVRGGEPGAARFGWEPPYPTADPTARAEAERVTDAICESPFTTLDVNERSELVDLVAELRTTLD